MEKNELTDINKEKFLNKFSKRLNEILIKKNLSSYQLINITGFSNSRISALINGKSNITIWNLYKLCEALDIKIEDLF